MSTTINGFDLLQAIGQHPDTFADLSSDINKAAVALLKKHFKSKTMKLDVLRASRNALTPDVLALGLENLNEKELRTLARKLDNHHPDTASGNAQWLRRHIRALAASEAEPSAKPVRARRSTAQTSAKENKKAPTKSDTTPHWPESMRAKPSRRR
jgi:hypothetical protein